jgi:K+-sensing histidine kinase KdpD
MKGPLLLLLTNIFAHRIDDIEPGLDPDPKDSVKVISQKTKVKDLYFDLLKSSKKEIMLIYPSNKAFIHQQRVEIIDVVKQVAKEKNVKVRVLVPVRVALFPLKENQQDHINNIHIKYIVEDLSPDTQATILIVDRKVSLVIELSDDTKDNFYEAIGLSAYSDNKAAVLSYVSLFENLWKQSELYQEIIESHEQLKKANEKLRIDDRILNEFIQITAHEIRNPIQPMLGLSQTIKSMIRQKEEELDINKVCDYLDIIIRNPRKLHKLTDDVLDITKIETDSLRLKKETFNINELIQDLISEYISQNNDAKRTDSSTYRNIKLSLFPSNIEEHQNADLFPIESDRGRISQVISNFLSNAFNFTNEGDTIYVNVEKKIPPAA